MILYRWILQDGFPKNKDVLQHNHNVITMLRKFNTAKLVLPNIKSMFKFS